MRRMQKPATMLLRMLLLVPLFVASFADGVERPVEVQLAYIMALKLLFCLALFAAGNMAKTLLAKLLASHVHKRSFFDKMQDALEKVRLALSVVDRDHATCFCFIGLERRAADFSVT